MPSPITQTVKVVVRHSANCKDKEQGSDWQKCKCLKSLLVYEGEGRGKNRRVATGQWDWDKAAVAAQELRDSWNPDLVELKRLRAEKATEIKKQMSLIEAVSIYHADMKARLGEGGTLQMSESLFGRIDPETMTIAVVTSKRGNPKTKITTTKTKRMAGHFFRWLESYNATNEDKLVSVADIRGEHLMNWRSGWKFKSDLTRKNKWGCVRAFFSFCESMGWIQDSPARKLKQFDVAKGNRTAVFTDEQYRAILDAVNL